MNTFDILANHENIVKVLYKDYIKWFRHPVNKHNPNIAVHARVVFEAYMKVMNEQYTVCGNYIETKEYRYYLLTTNDKQAFDDYFKVVKGSKRKSKIVLMLSGEFVDLNMVESMKTEKFSEMFTNMTIDRLVNSGVDINCLRKCKFFD